MSTVKYFLKLLDTKLKQCEPKMGFNLKICFYQWLKATSVRKPFCHKVVLDV